jgi:S-adenosyl-L-methionine hydrolase (adenosine-forming)
MPTRRPLITLTTDFGTSDHFVGAMKGVIQSICPAATLVDITHDLNPYEITEGAFTFGEAWRWFPKGTVHLAIVDPGVGSGRRPILVEAAGHSFVGPDNGLLTSVLNEPKSVTRVMTNMRYFLKAVSHTFHGRDVFAPAAAHRAAGRPPASFGRKVEDALRLNLGKPVQTSKRQWTGTILKIDRFGNCITNFHERDFGWIRTNPFVFTIGFEQVAGLATHYAECPYDEFRAVVGSSGYVEIVLREAHAAKKMGVAAGAPVELMGWAKEE